MAKSKTTAEGGKVKDSDALSEYSVIARRYRPQQFADLVGQEGVSQSLVNALKSGRVAHAYLFTGTRGTGKTSTARILAKALNCVKGPTTTPCGECESCRAIAVGDDVDVMEIDGASNRNLDDIRELRSNVQYRPSRSRFKIYIIDEVHQLTKDSFNALLKTLEEPPSHVKFIFATTDVQKVPLTILSRCQRFDFSGIGVKAIVERLREIVQAENKDAEEEALELIARRAGGSMRDAQSLLDQLLAFGGDKLTRDQIHQLLGTAHEDQVAALATVILAKDVPNALTQLDQAADQGVQFGEMLDQLIEYWRDLMLMKSAGPKFNGLSFPSRFHDAMAAQATAMNLDAILAGIDILAATKSRLRTSSHPRVLMEMAVIRLGQLENLLPLSQLAQLLNGQGGAVRASTAAPMPRPALSAPTAVKKNALSENGVPATAVTSPKATTLSAVNLGEVWAQVLTAVGPMFGAELGRGIPAISGPNNLVVRFSPRYNKEKERCQESAKTDRLEEVVAKIIGERVAVRFESGPEESRASPPSAESKPPRGKQLRDAALRVPLVLRAVSELDAQLIPGSTEDGFGAGFAESTTEAIMVESEG